MKKLLAAGLVLSVAVALAIVFGVRAGNSAGDSVKDEGHSVGVVSYKVWDKDGNLKEEMVLHNATLAAFLNDARTYLCCSTATLAEADQYDNIQAASADASGATPTLSTNLDANPAEATGTAGATGVYTATKTFTASGASTIEELQLSKGTVVNGTAQSGVGAWRNVSITLASGDTLAVTWTITIS